jgi:hypothetical protein
MTPTENLYPKARTNCLLCCGTVPTDGGHVAHEDHLFGNKTIVWFSAKYVKQGNRLWNLQVWVKLYSDKTRLQGKEVTYK